jgi:hypothetical protein
LIRWQSVDELLETAPALKKRNEIMDKIAVRAFGEGKDIVTVNQDGDVVAGLLALRAAAAQGHERVRTKEVYHADLRPADQRTVIDLAIKRVHQRLGEPEGSIKSGRAVELMAVGWLNTVGWPK